MFHCLHSLDKLRTLCEEHMNRALFNKVADEAELDAVMIACVEKQFWRWVSCALKYVFKPLEDLRRWGLLCTCHEAARRAGIKKAGHHCPWNSRRLRQAAPKIKRAVAGFKEQANLLVLADCEGDIQLHTWMVACLRAVAVDLETTFKYLGIVPWAFCNADTQDGSSSVFATMGFNL